MGRKIKGFRTLSGQGHKTSFKGVPCLVNKQYKHRTLGELVAMYHATGEIPPVGQRAGYYMANKGIDSEFPTTRDEFEDIIRAREAARELREFQSAKQSEIDSAVKAAVKAANDAKDKEIAELKSRLSKSE